MDPELGTSPENPPSENSTSPENSTPSPPEDFPVLWLQQTLTKDFNRAIAPINFPGVRHGILIPLLYLLQCIGIMMVPGKLMILGLVISEEKPP